MAQAWYIQLDGKAVGPLNSAQLKRLAHGERISPATKIRAGVDGKWLDAARVKGLFPPTTKPQSASATTPPQPAASAAKRLSVGSPTIEDLRQRKPPGETKSANPFRPPVSSGRPKTTRRHRSDSHSPQGLAQAFLSIWFAPRETIRWAIAARKGSDAIMLAMIGFGLAFVDNCLLTSEGVLMSPALLFAPIGVPISAAIGLLPLYVIGFADQIVGALLGGKGDHPSLRTAFAWSLVPSILSLPVTLVFILVILVAPAILDAPGFLLSLPHIVLFLWGIIIHIAGISAAHQFSIPRAVATFLLSFVMLGVAFSIIIVFGLLIAMMVGLLLGH